MSRFSPLLLGDDDDAPTRRGFLGLAALLVGLPRLERAAALLPVRGRLGGDDPFTLGVASGDPSPTGVVLWTRLARRPLDPDGGMPKEAVRLEWVVAEDEALRKIVAKGSALAGPGSGHAVHVEVEGLRADRPYWYRFRTAEAESPLGRTRTLPAPDAAPESFRFAFASCQHFESGHYAAYRQMAADDPDLVFFLGDYIYEGKGDPKPRTPEDRVRIHVGRKLKSLGDYRRRHAQYRADPLLQAMHARCPWFVTWDDHEFENNYAGVVSSLEGTDPAEFLRRRAAAYRAYYEMMPLRPSSMPSGPDMTLYRRAQWGRLVDFCVLDTRQYRTDQPNGDGAKPLNEAALAPENTMLGAKQRAWLEGALAEPKGVWTLIAQQVMMAMIAHRDRDENVTYRMDQWSGYAAERMRLVKFMQEKRTPNPVVITGDVHSNWANDLRVDDRDPKSPVVAAEFVGTSISSGGRGTETPSTVPKLLRDNAGVRWHNAERGYVRCVATPREWRTDYVVVDDVLRADSACRVRASFVATAGRPGLVRA